ncbi:maleylpyruvate isomerase family mycothiol-dependent enzyme [Nesterenkonia sp. CF4.4]|uniref:maleylpyruvate isomerase family mycothiol-dependent enzyme n=1 Tax=Nesterenkonia sp. CF4.4 TaxID=3373079 RepID=UPI003EE5D316
MADDEGAARRGPPLEQLAGLQHAFESQLAGAALEAKVPHCGGWSVQELAEHLGAVHLWAAGKVLGEKLELPDSGVVVQNLSDSRASAARYRAAAGLLRTTLASVPIDQPCQTLAGVGSASFWQRRQTHETLIHLWDLCQALGSPMPPVEAAVWEDCVAEVVEVMHPRQIRLGRASAPPHSLLLVAESTPGRWRLPAESSAEPSARITASAAELALLLWGRRSLEGLAVRGDHAAATAVLTGALTP